MGEKEVGGGRRKGRGQLWGLTLYCVGATDGGFEVACWQEYGGWVVRRVDMFFLHHSYALTPSHIQPCPIPSL